ncbi:MAG TPA: hypothetical protein VKA00_07375 [Trueperaceae bacterium]|nr:hypothetical protein [Trueperaceae bacterium]
MTAQPIHRRAGIGPQAARVRVALAAGLVAVLLAVSSASAQDARSLGMGGVRVPGRGAADVNPAFAALPASAGGSLALPLGLLSGLTRDTWNPAAQGFDALSALDQVSTIGQYLLNPAVSPDDVTFSVDASGLGIAFSGGSPMRLTDPTTLDAGFDLPLGGRLGPVTLGVRPFMEVRARFTPGPDLRAVFGTGSTSASGTLTADAEAGVAVDVGAALPIPLPPAALGGGSLYAGVRASGIAGLARARASFQGSAQAQQDSSGTYTDVTYSYDGTLGTGGLMDGNVGYGALGAAGLAATVPAGIGTVGLGVSVRHIGVMIWDLRRTRYQGDQNGSSTTDLGWVHSVEVAQHVRVGANLAYTVAEGHLGVPGMGLTLAADGDLDLDGGSAAHTGAELRLGPAALRAGVGYQDGLRLGVGAGVSAGGVGLDVALSSHRSPFTDHQAYGVSASLAFGF